LTDVISNYILFAEYTYKKEKLLAYNYLKKEIMRKYHQNQQPEQPIFFYGLIPGAMIGLTYLTGSKAKLISLF